MWAMTEAVTTRSLETGLARACLALGRICADEATRAGATDLRIALVKHAIVFLDTACTLLPAEPGSAMHPAKNPCGRNRPLAGEGDERQGA